MRRVIVGAALVLSACGGELASPAQPAPPRVTDTACDWVGPMTFSANDTPTTKEEILAYEMARRRNCPRDTTPSGNPATSVGDGT